MIRTLTASCGTIKATSRKTHAEGSGSTACQFRRRIQSDSGTCHSQMEPEGIRTFARRIGAADGKVRWATRERIYGKTGSMGPPLSLDNCYLPVIGHAKMYVGSWHVNYSLDSDASKVPSTEQEAHNSPGGNPICRNVWDWHPWSVHLDLFVLEHCPGRSKDSYWTQMGRESELASLLSSRHRCHYPNLKLWRLLKRQKRAEKGVGAASSWRSPTHAG
jgi:hypothetical protein